MAGAFLRVTGEGDVYSADDVRDWIEATGWQMLEHQPLAGPTSLMVAEKAVYRRPPGLTIVCPWRFLASGPRAGFQRQATCRVRSRQQRTPMTRRWKIPGLIATPLTGETARDHKTNPMASGILMAWHTPHGQWQLMAQQTMTREAPRTH